MVGDAVIDVPAGQSKELGLRTGSIVVNGKILSGRGFLKIAKINGGVGSNGQTNELNDLSDVSINSPSSGELLGFNGTSFTNQPVSSFGFLTSSRQVQTSLPLSGGGALSSDLTISMQQASSSLNGFLSAADHALFTAKQNHSDNLDDISGLSVSPGDILYVDANSDINRLPKGTDGQYLSLVSGQPAWTNAPTGEGEETMELIYANTVVQSSSDSADITDSFTASGSSTYLFVATLGSVYPSVSAGSYGELKIKIDGTDFVTAGSASTVGPRATNYGASGLAVDSLDRVFKKTMSGLSGSVTITYEKGASTQNVVQLEIYKL